MRFAYLALAAAIAAIPSIANAAWNGSGWYVTYSDVGGDYAIYSGPYSDQSQCEADAKRLDSRVGSIGSGGDCEYLQKELPSLTNAEIREMDATPATGHGGSGQPASSSSAGIDCAWADEHTCLDLASIRPEDEKAHFTAHFTSYDCATANTGPPDGKCNQMLFEVNCITGLAYGGETADGLKKMDAEWPPDSPLMKKLCPNYDAASAKQQRCLGGRPRLTNEEQLQACNELVAAASDKQERAKYYDWRGGYYYNAVKQYPEAIRDYTTAIGLDPKADYYDSRSNAYGAQKKWDLAIADLNKSIKLEPDKAVWVGVRGIMNDNAKRYEAALGDFKRSLALDPNNFIIRDQLAEVHLKLRRYPEALSDAEQIIAKTPNYPEGYYFRSVAERALGKGSAADADLAKARELKPEVEDIYGKSIQPDAAPARKAIKH